MRRKFSVRCARYVISPPDASGAYSIDFKHTFTAASEKVVLDRTAPQSPGRPPWGGSPVSRCGPPPP